MILDDIQCRGITKKVEANRPKCRRELQTRAGLGRSKNELSIHFFFSISSIPKPVPGPSMNNLNRFVLLALFRRKGPYYRSLNHQLAVQRREEVAGRWRGVEARDPRSKFGELDKSRALAPSLSSDAGSFSERTLPGIWRRYCNAVARRRACRVFRHSQARESATSQPRGEPSTIYTR